jgi:hypothetical protein
LGLMAMAALSCTRSALGLDRATGLSERMSFAERNPKPCTVPLRPAFAQAALKPEEAGAEAARASARVSFKSPRRGSLDLA